MTDQEKKALQSTRGNLRNLRKLKNSNHLQRFRNEDIQQYIASRKQEQDTILKELRKERAFWQIELENKIQRIFLESRTKISRQCERKGSKGNLGLPWWHSG